MNFLKYSLLSVAAIGATVAFHHIGVYSASVVMGFVAGFFISQMGQRMRACIDHKNTREDQ